jgi:hypothetical protein
MSPEEREKLLAEVAAEKQLSQDADTTVVTNIVKDE